MIIAELSASVCIIFSEINQQMLPEQGVGKIGENSHWQKTAPITHRSPPEATQMDLCQKQLQKELLSGKEDIEIVKFVQGYMSV